MNRPGVVGLGLVAVALGSNANELAGNVSLGWRNVSIDGADNKYRQHVNLSDGARILGLRVDFQPSDPAQQLPDRIIFSAANLGGDPFENIFLKVRKYGNYDFRYNHRKSSYFYDDLLVDPANASIDGSTGGDFHRFDFEREQYSIDLNVFFTARATGSLAFNRYTKDGSSTTTRDIQRDEFEIDQTIDEVDQNAAIGFKYRWNNATLAVEQSIREYDNESELVLPGFSAGENPDDLAFLDFYFFQQPYSYDSYRTLISFSNQPHTRFEWRFKSQFSDLDLDFGGVENAQGIDFLGNPFSTNTMRTGDVNREIQTYDLDGSFALTDNLNVSAAVRHRHIDQDGRSELKPADDTRDWDIKTTASDLGIEYSLAPGMTIAVGWSIERREADTFEDSVSGFVASNVDTDRDGFFASIEYRPSRKFSVTAAIEKNQIDDPYTLASPTDMIRYRLRGRYKFDNGINLTVTHKVRDYDNDNTGWSRKDEQTDLRIIYDVKRLNTSAGVSYIDIDRDYAQLVTGGTRQDLLSAAYRADTTLLDGRVEYAVTDSLIVGGKLWLYDNDGSFKVDNRDFSAFVEYRLPQNYRLHASYRNVDYEEDLEQYDVDIFEFGVALRW